jgi:hypothetical protein
MARKVKDSWFLAAGFLFWKPDGSRPTGSSLCLWLEEALFDQE